MASIFWLSWCLRTRMLWRQRSGTDLPGATTSHHFPSQRWMIIQAWLSHWGLQAELETLWSWRRWTCRLLPIFARFISKSAVSSSRSGSSFMTFNSSSPFALNVIVVLLIMIWCLILFCASGTALILSPSTSEVGVSIPIHHWNWRVSDSGMYDRIDLDTLVSFCVDDDSCFFSSFWHAPFSMNGIVLLMSSGIDLPSLKSIYVGDSCFHETPRVEIASEDELRHLAHRSSSIGVIAHWFIRLYGK